MSDPYYLLGPIDYPGPVFITLNKQKVSYFLTLTSDNELIFDPRKVTPLELRLDSTQQGTQFSFVAQGETANYIGGKNNGSDTTNDTVIASPTTKATALIPMNTEVNPWGGNVAFLAGVHYSFSTTSSETVQWQAYVPDQIENGIVITIKMDNGNPVIQTFTSTIRFLPTKWFEAGSCAQTSDVQAVIDAEILWVTETGQVPEGYTDKADCETGVRYTYCGPEVDCSGMCKGPCPNKDQVCTYVVGGDSLDATVTDSFKCMTGEPPTKPIWERPWVWVAAIFIILVVLGIFFVLLSNIESKKSK